MRMRMQKRGRSARLQKRRRTPRRRDMRRRRRLKSKMRMRHHRQVLPLWRDRKRRQRTTHRLSCLFDVNARILMVRQHIAFSSTILKLYAKKFKGFTR
jgi:hypothetical protein